MNHQTLIKQLGTALPMMGAKDLVAGNDALYFRIGRNPKGVNKVSITLAADLYTVTAFKVDRYGNWTQKGQAEGVYADQLHQVLESLTGLYTRL